MVIAAVMLAAVAYLTGTVVIARRRPAGRWPAGRTGAFCAATGVIAVAVRLGHDHVLAVHMVQHLSLIMVAPPLLVYARPVTLLLHATRNPAHTRVKRVVRSAAASALTWPPLTVAVYTAVVAATHLTPMAALVLRVPPLHAAEHLAYLAAGYLFFLPVIGSEPLRWRLSPLGRYLMLLAAMPADITTGAILMLTRRPLFGYQPPDLQAGGLVMLAGSELIMVALAVMIAARMIWAAEPAPGVTPAHARQRSAG